MRQALQRLWDRAIAVVSPILDSAKKLWRWLREETFIADIIALMEQIRAGWRTVVRLWDWLLAEGESWLVTMAEQLRTSVIAPLLGLFRKLGQFVRSAVDSLGAFVRGLILAFDDALLWLGRLVGLESLARLISALLAPLRMLALVVFDCYLAALRGFAWMIENVDQVLRTVLDILVGVSVALLAPPLSIIAFLGGAVWIYLIPQCMKGPIIDFMLTVLLRIVNFIPVPNDPILAAIQAGMQGVLTALLAAPTEQKIRVVDLIARVFAGDVEIGAGMVVGFLKAIWDSTIGLVIDLLSALTWVFSWSLEGVGLLSSAPAQEGEATAVPEGSVDAPELDDEDLLDLEQAPTGEDVEFGPPTDDDVQNWERGADSIAADTDTDRSDGFDSTRPPELPEEVIQIRDFLQAFVESRITAEDLQSFLLQMRDRLSATVRETSADAARGVLSRLDAEGTGYQIGRAVGYVYGLVTVIVVLALLTAGVGSAAVTAELAASNAASAAARGAATLASQGGSFAAAAMRAVQALRSVGAPLLRGLNTLRGGRFGPLIARLEQWFVRMMEWLRPLIARVRGLPRTIRTTWNNMPKWMRDDARTWARWRAIAGARVALAWQQLRVRMNDKMIEQGELRRLLFALRLTMRREMPPGTRLQFRVEIEPERNRWHLEARVRQSLFSRTQRWTQRLLSASAQAGPGWYATDRKGKAWFSTAPAQQRTHERVVEAADQLIELALAQAMGEGSPDLRELHRRIRDDMDGIEQRAGAMLLRNVHIFIDEDEFESVTRNGVVELVYDYVISPNNSGGKIYASVPPSPWSGPVPETEVRYGSQRGTSEFGTRMVANPLSRAGVDGTPPTAPNGVWDVLRGRSSPQGGRSYYVRGHLLNHNMHGPGDDWRNLAVITQDANGEHLRRVEERVKKAVLEDGHVLEYQVRAIYGRTGVNSALLRAIDNDSTVEEGIRLIRRAIVENEVHLPDAFVCDAWWLNSDGSRGLALFTGVRIENEIDEAGPSSYVVTGVPPRALVSLNLSDPFPANRKRPRKDRQLALDAYMRLPGVGLTLAERLFKHRNRFRTWSDVQELFRISPRMTDRWRAVAGLTVKVRGGTTRWNPDY